MPIQRSPAQARKELAALEAARKRRIKVKTKPPTRESYISAMAGKEYAPSKIPSKAEIQKQRKKKFEKQLQAAGFAPASGFDKWMVHQAEQARDISAGLYQQGYDLATTLGTDLYNVPRHGGKEKFKTPGLLKDWAEGYWQGLEHYFDPTHPVRSLERIKHDTLTAVLLGYPAAHGLGRGISTGSIAAGIEPIVEGATKPGLTRRLKLGYKESKLPGYIGGEGAPGLRGGIEPRYIPHKTIYPEFKPTEDWIPPGNFTNVKGSLASKAARATPEENIRMVVSGEKPSGILGTTVSKNAIKQAKDQGLEVWQTKIPDEWGGGRQTYIAKNKAARSRLEEAQAVQDINEPAGDVLIGRALGYAEADIESYINHNWGMSIKEALKGATTDFVLPGSTYRPWSKTPIGRSFQRGFDRTSLWIESRHGPGAKFSPAQRGGTLYERASRKARQHLDIQITAGESVIREGISKTPKVSPYKKVAPDLDAALTVALEAPKSMSARAAVETAIKDLESLKETSLPKLEADQIARLQGQIDLLKKSLDGDFLESKAFDRALETATKISETADAYAAKYLNMSPEELASRRNRIAERWQERGLLPADMEVDARGYFPHRSEHEVIPSGTPVPVRPRGDVIGQGQLGPSFRKQYNALIQYQTGTLQRRIGNLTGTVRQRYGIEQKLGVRQFLADIGRPVREGDPLPGKNFMFVRISKERIPKEMLDALRNGDDIPLEDIYKWTNEWTKPGDKVPVEWAQDMNNVRIVPRGVVNAVLSDISRGNIGQATSIAGALNNLVRMSILYLPYGGARYVVRNFMQNLILMSMTHPGSFKPLLVDVARVAIEDPELSRMIRVEAGTIPAAAGLPEIFKPGKLEKWNNTSKQIANVLGNLADEGPRMAAWIRYAKAYGYKDQAAWRRLLESENPAEVNIRGNVSQYVRDDMIDFDTLNPYEREVLTRWLFIYPFTKGAAKWPFMFFREYPIRASVLALIGAQADREGRIPGMPLSTQESGRIDRAQLSWASPWDPMAQSIERGIGVVQGFKESGFSRVPLMNLSEFLAPGIRQGGQAFFGEGAPIKSLARTFIPGYSTVKNIQRGGGLEQQILRALGTVVETPQFRVDERKAEGKAVLDAWRIAGSGYNADEVTMGFRIHEDFKDLRSRADFAARDLGRKVRLWEKASLLTYTISHYRTDLPLWSYEDIKKESKTNPKNLDAYYKWLQKSWQVVTNLKGEATRATNEQEQHGG